MQRHHEQAVRENPLYRLEGMLDVLREDLMMNMPVFPEIKPPEVIPLKTEVIHRYAEPVKKKRYSKYD